MFYVFEQDNPGGAWVRDDKLDQLVVIEASDAVSALALAEAMGVYLDGVEKDIDCECCGDRWYGPEAAPIISFEDAAGRWPLMPEWAKSTKFHYEDGRIETKKGCFYYSKHLIVP